MNQINRESRKKVNKIYNQSVIYVLIASALSVPFLTPAKVKQPKKTMVNHPVVIHAKAEETLTEPLPETKPVVLASTIATKTPEPVEVVPRMVMKILKGVKIVATPKVFQQTINPKALGKKKTIEPVKSANGQITIQQTKIDRKFIDKMEGVILTGYVPLPKTSQSGVTIASGFDLGQMHLKEFNQLPMTLALKTKLAPYVGLKRFQAVAFLKKHPLSITTAEMHELNQIAANKILQPLVTSYNKASKIPFEKLPPQAQTALFSFAYQYGSNFMNRPSTHQLWNYYVTQNWQKVKQTLHNFKMYSHRRKQEALLINHF